MPADGIGPGKCFAGSTAAGMLKTRLAAAAVLLPAAIVWALYAPPLVYAVVAGVLLLVAAWEWAALAGYRGVFARLAYLATACLLMALAWWALGYPALGPFLLGAFVLFWIVTAADLWRGRLAAPRAAFAVQGLLVLVPAWFSFLVLRRYQPEGRWLVLALLLIVWAADAAAYFVGRAWGRRRLAPRLSPAKSWEGLAGGLAGAALAGAVAGIWSPVGPATLAPLAIVAALLSVVGDLAESRLKRASGAKDSGSLIPGHGGMLDRIDSITAAAPVFAFSLSLLGMPR